MRNTLICIAVFLFVAACGTATSSIDEIRDRLNENSCRINREELVFQLQNLEYLQDTTFSEIPEFLLDDSLLVCPATSQLYVMVVDGNDRTIICPAGHGESSF